MYTLLRWIAEWKGRRRGAQVIVFDGGAEVERTRAFFRGVVTGIGVATFAFVLMSPATLGAGLAEELRRRDAQLREARQRADQAVALAGVCLSTAETMKETLDGYRRMVQAYPGLLRR